jgi:hypothetical protein
MPTKKKEANKPPSGRPAKGAIAAKGGTAAPAEAKPKHQVHITKAKGRPMLSWVGKRPLRAVTAFPAQYVESFIAPGADKMPVADAAVWKDWPDRYPRGGLLFHGDNKEVLAHLLANGFRGKVQLIYIDPPFDSGADYLRKVNLRGPVGTVKFEGESYSLGEQIQYTDIWANDNYLQFMFERLMLLKELLHDEKGFIGLQCDWRKAHHLRSLLDEVFGADNFRGEILIRAGTKNVQSQFAEVSNLTTGNNSIFLYSKSRDAKLPKLVSESAEYEPGKWDTFWRGTDRPTMRYELLGITPSDGQWRWERIRAERAIRNYEKYQHDFAKSMALDDYSVSVRDGEGASLDFVRREKSGTVQYYIPPRNYKLLSNVWFDLAYRGTKTGYPTEKSEEPIERLVSWLTVPRSIVFDCFLGSGTTAAVAQKCGRRWIGCDINKGAIQTTTKRLQAVIAEQIAAANEASKQQDFLGDGGVDTPKPAQLGFTVHRVNDYDLAIQHNEAVNLACEHIGITRTLAGAFFDGNLGAKLVKIVPFGHPLSLVDLEDVKRELNTRTNESRDIVMVSLGKEISVDDWLGEWNRMRKQGDTPNKIEVIELRSDPKYGKFIAHKLAQARVDIRRLKGKDGDKLVVDVKDFISPSITERLQNQAGVLAPKIPDWRAMVDSVMIDPAHNGKVFNIGLADVPESKQDYVRGIYELSAQVNRTTVAVKVTDMLGEEVIVTKEV